MKINVDFIREENLYTSGQFKFNGEQYLKYADFIIYENGEYSHFVLIKNKKFFMFKEYQTMKDIPIVLNVLMCYRRRK